MINDLDMQGWAYLLAPTFQFVNTAGKPLTEGYLEVYIAGTRNKYYCASDFNGTLHPFQIPLDSLGSNIVLADPSQAYDVYAYNRFGSLVMSRYNVSPSNAGGSGVLTITISSNDDTVQVVHDGNNYDLSIADTIARIDDIEDRLDEIGDGSVGYAVAHSELASDGLFELTNDKNKDIDYTGDMHGFRLKPGHVYQLNFNAKFDCNNDTNDLISGKFYLDGDNVVAQEWQFNVDNSFEHQESFNGSTVLVIPEDVSYYDVKLKYSFDDEALDLYLNKISIVDVTSIVSQGASGGGVEYTDGDGIIVDNSNHTINVDMDYINSHLDIDASSILSSAYNYTDAKVSQVSGDIVNIISEVTGSLPIPEQVQSDWNQDDDTQVDYIKNKPDLDIYATHDELETTVTNVVSSVSSVLQNEIDNIPTQVQSDWEEDNTSSPAYIQHKPEVEDVEFEEINLDDYALASAIPDISNLSTKDELNVASGNIINYVDNSIDNVTNVIESVSGDLQEQINNIPAQVQSDWNESDVDSPAYIDNKPDLSIYATETQLETVSGDIVAMIPDPQIQSDWTQTDNTQVDYIKNKPEEESVEFEEINLNDYALASAVPSIEGLATVEQVSSVSSVLKNEIDNIPEQVNADWESNSGKSEILNKPDLSIYATHNEVSGVSGNIINYVNEQIGDIPTPVQSDWAEDDSQDLSYIKNKPTERQLIPGDNISITASGNNFVISAEGEVSLEDLATVSGNIIAQIPDAQVQANWNESDITQPSYIQNKPDLSNFATIDDVNEVTSLIPEAQVQSDWTEDDTNEPSYILNKPNELELVAGNNIEIAVSGTNIVISSTASAVTGLDLLYGQFTSNNVSTTATMAKSKGNINVSDGKIQLEQGKSYHVTVRGYYQQTNAANSYSPISYVEYITSNSINIDIDRSRTDAQYFELSYDLFNLNSDVDYQVAFSGGAGLVKDLIVEVHSLGGAGTGSSSGGSAIEYDAGYGINIANNVISVDSSIIPDTSTMATKAEVANVSGTIVGMIPNTSNLATKAELNSVSANIVGQIPDVSNYATTTDLTNACNNVISMIPELPESANLIAGNNITITASGNDYVISSTASGGGAGTTYTAGDGIVINNNEISVDNTIALKSELSAVSGKLPTTETGKFTIQNNVSGGPIEVICPTDVGMPVNTNIVTESDVSGINISSTTSKLVVYNSPGFDVDYWNYTNGQITLTVPEEITGIYSIVAYYSNNSNPLGSSAPYFISNYVVPDTTNYKLVAGNYTITTNSNQASQGYGKYLTFILSGPDPDIEAFTKVTIKGFERHPELGISVDLDRYYLGNTSTTTSNSGTQAVIYTDPTTKKQSVFLPTSMPSNWKSSANSIIQYGSNTLPNTSPTVYGGAYKQITGGWNPEYQWGVCTYVNSASNSRIATYLSYNKSTGELEKWTLDWNTSPYTWTTETISINTDDFIPYSASGVYLPNSKFEIDTDGQAYKVISKGSTTTTTTNYALDDTYIDLSELTAAGTFNIHIGDVITISNLKTSGRYPVTSVRFKFSGTGVVDWDISNISVTNSTATITSDRDGTYTNLTVYLEPQGYADSTGLETLTITHTETTPDVKDEYITETTLASAIPDVSNFATKAEVATATGDLQSQINNLPSQVQSNWTESDDSDPSYILNKPEEINLVGGDNITITVSGSSAIINGQAGGGGSTYTAGTGIDITNNTISVDNTIALKSEIPDVSNYATETYVDNAIAEIDIPEVSGASGISVNDNVISLDNPVGLVAGDNITIEVSGSSAIISSLGGGTTYSAGDGININNDEISIDNTVALKSEIPTLPQEEEIDFEEVDLSDYALVSAIPDVSDMATQTWVGNQGYLTSVPATYVTDTELASAVSGLATKNELNGKQDTLTGITDVQVVQSLPASPVATVLYLIPEV